MSHEAPARSQDTEKVPHESYSPTYLVGEVIERKSNNVTLRTLVVQAPAKMVFTEKQIPYLKDPVCKPGTLIVLERPKQADMLPVFVEDIGPKGAWSTEVSRLAYTIGNGDKFPQQVREVEAEIVRKGESVITEEIDYLKGKENGLINPDDPAFVSKFKHGESRVDWRNAPDVRIITIDPKTARDHDDALHIRRIVVDGKEFVEVGVHIADVTHFVPMQKGKFGHALFEEAEMRGSTLYTPRKAFPMLPHVLSEQLCSLEQGKERLAFSTVFLIDSDTGSIAQTWQGKSVISPHTHFAYEDAQKLHDSTEDLSAEDRQLQHDLGLLTSYGKKLREVRQARKEITFPARDELDASSNNSGEEIAGVKEDVEMQKVIQDFMVQANEAVAITITEKSVQNPDTFFTFLRFHEPPKLEDIKRIAQIYGAVDILSRIEEYEKDPTPEQGLGSNEPPFINQIVWELLERAQTMPLLGEVESERQIRTFIDQAKERGESHHLLGATDEETDRKIQERLAEVRDSWREHMKNQVMGLFTKAKYTTDPKAHFGLAAFPYTHFTSPIRRFADVMVHHLLQAALMNDNETLGGAKLEEFRKTIAHLNQRETVIDRAANRTKSIWGANLFGTLMTPENPNPEIQNAEILGVPMRDAEKNDRVVIIRMQHPSGSYRFTFEVPLSDFKGLPRDSESRQALIRKPITVRLTDIDISNGSLKLELVSEVGVVPRRVRIGAEVAETMKQFHMYDLEALEKEFKETFETTRGFRNELEDLKTRAQKITQSTPAGVVDTIGARIGSLRAALYRRSGMNFTDMLSRLNPLVAEQVPATNPATPANASDFAGAAQATRSDNIRTTRSTLARVAERETEARSRRKSTAELEREIERVQRRIRIEALERQIAELEARIRRES